MKLKFLLLGVSSAAALIISSLASSATPVTPDASSEGVVAFETPGTYTQVGPNPCVQVSTVGATIGCSGSTTTPTTGATLSYLTTATAGFGILKAAGQSQIIGANGVANMTELSTAYGQSYFDDSWTITGGTGTGTLELEFALDGSYNFCAVNSGETLGFGLVNLDDYSYSTGTPTLSACSGTVAKTVTLSTDFTFGSPVDIRVSLTAGSNLYNLGADISSDIDFSDTATMNAIVVMDATGDVVPFQLTTASQSPLFAQLAPAATTSVPEPMSLLILGGGLLGAGAVRRRVKR